LLGKAQASFRNQSSFLILADFDRLIPDIPLRVLNVIEDLQTTSDKESHAASEPRRAGADQWHAAD
jgi:hypothetical protein